MPFNSWQVDYAGHGQHNQIHKNALTVTIPSELALLGDLEVRKCKRQSPKIPNRSFPELQRSVTLWLETALPRYDNLRILQRRRETQRHAAETLFQGFVEDKAPRRA
jgi:hypothetical protein